MRRLIAIIVCALAVWGQAPAAKPDYDAAARERKSDWYFMEAMRQKALGNSTLYYALIRRADQLTADSTGRASYEVSLSDAYFADRRGDSLTMANAVRRMEQYFLANPSDAFAGVSVAEIYSEDGRTEDAIRVYETIVSRKPEDVNLNGNYADLLVRAGRGEDAIEIYRRLEGNMGRNQVLTQRIANVKLMSGDTIAALAEIDDLIGAQPRNVEALQLGVFAAGHLGEPERALEYAERALRLEPGNGNTYYLAMEAYRALGRDEEYARAVRGALMGEDLEYDAKMQLLEYYVRELYDDEEGNEEEELKPVLEALVRQYPRDRQVRLTYMRYFIAKAQYEEAAEQMETVVTLGGTQPGDYETLARVYASAKETAKALEATERGLKLFPEDMSLYQLQSAIKVNLEDPAGAAATLKHALETPLLTDSDRSELYMLLGDMAQTNPETGAAEEYYEKAIELDRANHMAMNNYAYYLATHGGDLLKAHELIGRAVLYEPESPTYYDTYAWVCFKLGQPEEARKYIDKALTLFGIGSDGESRLKEHPELMESLKGAATELLNHALEIYVTLGGEEDKVKEIKEKIKFYE